MSPHGPTSSDLTISLHPSGQEEVSTDRPSYRSLQRLAPNWTRASWKTDVSAISNCCDLYVPNFKVSDQSLNLEIRSMTQLPGLGFWLIIPAQNGCNCLTHTKSSGTLVWPVEACLLTYLWRHRSVLLSCLKNMNIIQVSKGLALIINRKASSRPSISNVSNTPRPDWGKMKRHVPIFSCYIQSHTQTASGE